VSTAPARTITQWTVSEPRKLTPAVGTGIKDEGKVVFHDVSRCDLHRMCVAVAGKYPDVETWMELLKEKRVIATRYTEKITSTGLFIGYLWFYWKEVSLK
jgi:hypothetical protein